MSPPGDAFYEWHPFQREGKDIICGEAYYQTPVM